MNELTTTSILALFDTNKAQREAFVTDLIEKMDEGSVDPLKIHYQVKCIEKIIEVLTVTDEKKNKNFQIAKRYKELILDAAQKYGQKAFDFRNSKIEIKEVGTRYDWVVCEDSWLLEKMAELDTLSSLIKARQELLKLVPAKGMILTDEETGETKTVYPPTKSSTTAVQVTLK